jgi:hypothetical protein
MVSVKSKDQIQVREPAPERLSPVVAQQVAGILEETGKPPREQQPKTNHWFYRTPFAGVRYYSY